MAGPSVPRPKARSNGSTAPRIRNLPTTPPIVTTSPASKPDWNSGDATSTTPSGRTKPWATPRPSPAGDPANAHDPPHCPPSDSPPTQSFVKSPPPEASAGDALRSPPATLSSASTSASRRTATSSTSGTGLTGSARFPRTGSTKAECYNPVQCHPCPCNTRHLFPCTEHVIKSGNVAA